MITYILRKFAYKGINTASQAKLIKLIAKRDILKSLCFASWALVAFLPAIPIYIIVLCEGEVPLSSTTKIAILAFTIVFCVGIFVFGALFYDAMLAFSTLVAKKIYFLTTTKRGKAISKEDFKFLEQVDNNVFLLISTGLCQGYCYGVCFDLLKALKKGRIEFLAITKITSQYNADDDGKEFTMHVLYVNNDWAFDTYSQRQCKLDEIHEIFEAKVYKSFGYEDIKGKTYEEFRALESKAAFDWANMNDCTCDWADDEE